MKRRHLLGLGLAGAALGALALKPRALGEPHAPYFSALNAELKKNGPGRPLLLVDLDRLNANLQKIKAQLNPQQAFRLVAKSLPATGLLQHCAQALNTDRLMVFHQPHMNALAQAMPRCDLLLGKPMPVSAAATFYRELKDSAFQPAGQLQWLIDSKARLLEYEQLARTLGVKMRVSLEIDIGLHRGGLSEPEALKDLLGHIAQAPGHLEFAGLMGYDAHVGKIPGVIESRASSFTQACDRYRAFKAVIKDQHPSLYHAGLVFNGAGSPTLRLHSSPESPLNEVAAGSCLLKPTGFDLDLLNDLLPACFIATPVLKALPGTQIPGLGEANRLFSAWNPNRAMSYFIYGGLWQARYESPEGLLDNPLYGKSSNQAIINSSTQLNLAVNDYVFLRPTQSEKVLQEFGDLAVVQGGKLMDW